MPIFCKSVRHIKVDYIHFEKLHFTCIKLQIFLLILMIMCFLLHLSIYKFLECVKNYFDWSINQYQNNSGVYFIYFCHGTLIRLSWTATACEEWEFPCKKSGRCIPSINKCDKHYDCGNEDFSDELNCRKSLFTL